MAKAVKEKPKCAGRSQGAVVQTGFSWERPEHRARPRDQRRGRGGGGSGSARPG